MTVTYPVKSPDPTTTWLVFQKTNPHAMLRLFCFPYAGAGPVVYRAWPESLHPQVEVASVQYPGRENRLREAPLSTLQPLLETLSGEIRPFLDKPFAFFGHSLGGLIAFELARLMRRQQLPQPKHLFISSRRAVHLPETHKPIHYLEDQAFTEAILIRYNGIPEVVWKDPELMSLFLPVLKADFALIETYQYYTEPAFDFPISAYGGYQDPNASQEELSAWKTHTSDRFTLEMFPGDHFFLQQQRLQLLKSVNDSLGEYLE